jgi:hypothetical protein
VTITERDWAQLEADRHAHGTTVRRVYPQSPHEIFIAVRHPDGSRMLTLGVTTRAAGEALRRLHTLPRTRGIEMQFARLGEGNGELRVALTDNNLREVFNPLASDIASTAQAELGPAEAVLAAVSRFEHWRRMLQSLADSGLVPEARRGLFGELTILRNHLLPALPAFDAVRAWTGPMAANQDFQLPHAAIEVKTSSGKEPQALVVSNERELDEKGVPRLVLAHLSLDERRGGNGESLNAAVDRTRDAATDAAARTLLDDLLVRAGYLRQQRELYDEPRYTVRKQHFWNVAGDFPRITEADLRPGVGDCRYSISTAGLEPHLLTADDIAEIISGRFPDE